MKSVRVRQVCVCACVQRSLAPLFGSKYVWFERELEVYSIIRDFLPVSPASDFSPMLSDVLNLSFSGKNETETSLICVMLRLGLEHEFTVKYA